MRCKDSVNLAGGTNCVSWLKRNVDEPESTSEGFASVLDLDDQLITEGLLSVLCAQTDFKAYGGYRVVCAPVLVPDVVIKIERYAHTVQNVLEFESWKFMQRYPALSKFYAPVRGCSANGRVLIQERVTRMLASCDLCRPEFRELRVPAGFVTDDCKMDNFGVITDGDGTARVVMVDYGFPDTIGYAREPMVTWATFAARVQPKGVYVERRVVTHERPFPVSKPAPDLVLDGAEGNPSHVRGRLRTKRKRKYTATIASTALQSARVRAKNLEDTHNDY